MIYDDTYIMQSCKYLLTFLSLVFTLSAQFYGGSFSEDSICLAVAKKNFLFGNTE